MLFFVNFNIKRKKSLAKPYMTYCPSFLACLSYDYYDHKKFTFNLLQLCVNISQKLYRCSYDSVWKEVVCGMR